jgi:tight adherence protein B
MSATLGAASHAVSFWSSTPALALVVGACALAFGVAVALILLKRSARGSVRQRVGEFVEPPTATGEPQVHADSEPGGMLARTERRLERERWWDELKERLDVARIDRPAIEVVYLTVACSIAAAVLCAAVIGTPIAGLIGLVLVPVIARGVINRSVERQRILFDEQLPAHLQELASAMRAGHSMISGIGVVADGAVEPTRGEFLRVMADEQLGMPLDHALRSASERMHARDMEQVALVAELHRQTGGNMAEVIDRVAESVRARAELSRELRTLTAQARGSRWIVTLIPPVLLLIIDVLNPTYLKPLFNTGTGQVLVGLAVVLMCAGSIVLGRIVRIEA